MDTINNFRMKPFSRIVWWSQKAKKHWYKKIGEVKRLYSQLETETMRKGIRDVCTLHISPKNYPEKITALDRAGVRFLPIRRVGYYKGFAHSHPEPEPGNWNFYGVASREWAKCKEFKTATRKGDHVKMGELLGYTADAGRFFQKEFAENGNKDLIWQIGNTEKLEEHKKLARPTKFTNIVLRYFGPRWIPFFPPEWEHEAADKLGEKFREIAYDINPEAAEGMDELLKMPCTWNVYHGVIEVVTPLFKGIANGMPTKNKYKLKVVPKSVSWPEYSSVPKELEDVEGSEKHDVGYLEEEM